MYSVEADTEKRLIVITAIDGVTAAEVKEAVTRVRELTRDFPPGFQALTDFRFLESMEPAAAHHIAAIMDDFASKKVARVLRVMPDPRKDIGLNILSTIHYKPDVEIATYETMAEAVAALLRDPPFDGAE
ncbi:MAG: hypothetical protein ACJ8KX_12055 [Chthoniobacterales bacterium]